MRAIFSHDPCTAAINLLDSGFMRFYRQARRVTHIVVTLLPLMALLVGSCKTSQTAFLMDDVYGGATPAQQFQASLFPDRVHSQGAHYLPAAGYVSQARSYVEGAPQTMTMLTKTEIGYIFGKPTFHRQDADAEVWQYKTAGCVVDFYFYGKKQLSYIDIRARSNAPAAPQESSCLHDIDAKHFASAEI